MKHLKRIDNVQYLNQLFYDIKEMIDTEFIDSWMEGPINYTEAKISHLRIHENEYITHLYIAVKNGDYALQKIVDELDHLKNVLLDVDNMILSYKTEWNNDCDEWEPTTKIGFEILIKQQ